MSQNLRWTTKQLAEHPKRDALLGLVNTIKQTPSTTKCIQPHVPAPKPAPASLPPIAENEFFYQCTVPGKPIGKPRQTQRDKWKQRPCVLRYRDYCDRIRAHAKLDPSWDCYAIEIAAYASMPPSWSQKKKARLMGQMLRGKPDWDNIGKAVCDALFKEDSGLAGGTVWKFWTDSAHARTEITVLFYQR